jgi:hypothetical protein
VIHTVTHPSFDRALDQFILAAAKAIGAKRSSLEYLIIRNYESPKIPLYVPVARQQPLLDFFHLA